MRSQLDRRFFVFLLLSLASLTAETPSSRGSSPITRIAGIGITVSNIDRAVDFYSKVLSFEKISDTEAAGPEYEQLFGVFGVRLRAVRMKLGDESIQLMEFITPRGRPIPVDSHSNDRWFQHIAIVVSDIDRAYVVLRQNRVEHASTGPQRLPNWNKNASGIKAFYFKDPDGHPLEIIQFPNGKGAPKWQRPTTRTFLGIDHTAIVVADTDSSLAFYRDVLGLRVTGESENYGTEQEHLNNVFGAHLRITSLHANSGPGIELLEYLSPRDGRPASLDVHANDLVFRDTMLLSDDLSSTEQVLRKRRTEFVSTKDVTFREVDALTFKKALIVHDPDAHAVLIAQAN
jgi:catechol 2,3-dioxygenase-like lactoylglutathione lyase family enzyme